MSKLVTLKVTNNSTFINEALDKEVLNELKKKLGYMPENAAFIVANAKFSSPDYDGHKSVMCLGKRWCKCAIKKDGVHFPTGLIHVAKDFLEKKGYAVKLVDARIKVVNDFKKYHHNIKLRPYQRTAVEKAKSRQRGIIKMATGAGKTLSSAALIVETGAFPFIFYVPSLDLLNQTKKEFEQFIFNSDGSPSKIGIIGGGECDIQDINVMTQQTAMRALGKGNIKLDEDSKREKDGDNVKAKYEDIKNLIMNAKGMMADECIVGDSIIQTKDGPKKIKELSNYKNEVLSFSSNSIGWNKITNFSEKGIQEIIQFTLLSGKKIECTKEHPIMTQKGWRMASEISLKDQILSIVNADVVKELMSKEDIQVNTQNSYLDINVVKKDKKNGNEISLLQKSDCHIANADVVVGLISNTIQSNLLLKQEEAENMQLMLSDMTKEILHGKYLCLNMKSKLYLELCLETLACLIHAKTAETLDLYGIMDYAKKNGHCINVNILKGLMQNITSLKTKDGETLQLIVEQFALQFLRKFIKLFIKMAKKHYPRNGLIQLETLGCHGGSVTMDQRLLMGLDCIQKDFKKKKLTLSVNGSTIDMVKPQLIKRGKKINTLWQYARRLEKKFKKQSGTVIQKAWGINFVGIKSIENGGSKKVYDIEVENAHNFFANDILVHNCQFWGAESCQIISDSSEKCFYKWACSGTPYRDQGDDILIESCFGKVIEDINASMLIDLGFLVKPDIYMVPVKNKYGTLKSHSYQEVYKEAIVENSLRNGYISKITKNMVDQNRMVLILVRQINHGKILEELIPGSKFISGTSSKKKRKEHIDAMRLHDAPVTIATSLPYEEMILIKDKGFIKHVEIGYLCEKLGDSVNQGEIEAICSFDGKTIGWSKITHVHKHLRKNKVMCITTDRKEEILATEDHPLLDVDLKSHLPSVGSPASCPMSNPLKNKIYDKINLLDILPDEENIEVEILGLNQAKIRMLTSERKYIKDKMLVSKSTRHRVRKKFSSMGKNYPKAVVELMDNFKYYKKKYRTTISVANGLKHVYSFFDAKIYVRRSRKKFNLPVSLDVNKEFAMLCGLLCAEGHMSHAGCNTCKSKYDVIFSGLEDMSNSTEGHNDINKKEIRKIFKECNKKSIKCPIIENDKQIRLNCKLLFLLLHSLKLIDQDGNKRVPDFIFNSNKEIQEAFLYGFYLGDGSKKLDYRNGKKEPSVFTATILCNSSRPMICGLVMLLRIMGKRFYINSHQGYNNTKKRYTINIVDNIYNLTTTRLQNKIKFDEVKRKQISVVPHEKQDKYVYDISVAGCHNFIAGLGVLAHNCIFDQGIDVRPLQVLIQAGSGKSSTRALQRVGRVIRPYEYPDGTKKEEAIVIDFMDHCRYMLGHSKKRLRIYETEPEFNIETLNI